MQARVTAAVLIGHRRWNLRSDNGIDIKLPEQACRGCCGCALPTLERQHHLLDKDMSVIDLRQADKLVVRQAHPAAAEEADGKKTDKTASKVPGECDPRRQGNPDPGGDALVGTRRQKQRDRLEQRQT